MDTQTRHALKKDKFAQAAASSASWIGEHKSGFLRWVILAAGVIVVVAAGWIYCALHSAKADAALDGALDVYTTPLAQPGAPPEAGTYSTEADKDKEANREFVAVAQNFGWTAAGAKAHYFAGVTYEAMGQNGSAETELTTASHAWDRNLSNLAKIALAGIYRQTARDNEAVELYNQVIAKPSETVSAAVAQLDLADLYVSEGKKDQARTIWAKIQGADKDGVPGQIAAQKLAEK